MCVCEGETETQTHTDTHTHTHTHTHTEGQRGEIETEIHRELVEVGGHLGAVCSLPPPLHEF